MSRVKNINFKCPNCGQENLILKEGVYMCPACLKPGENFECAKCGSKKVIIKVKSE